MNPRALLAGVCYLLAGIVSMPAFALLLRWGLFDDALCTQELCTPAGDWVAFTALGLVVLSLGAAAVGVKLCPQAFGRSEV